jgi:hypothetical protein
MTPLVALMLMHWRGQAYMQVGSSHSRQAMDMMFVGGRRTSRMWEARGL